MPPSDPPAFGTAPGFPGYHHEREQYDAKERRVDPGARQEVATMPRHDADPVPPRTAPVMPSMPPGFVYVSGDPPRGTFEVTPDGRGWQPIDPMDPRIHTVPAVTRRAEVPSLHAAAGQAMRPRDPLHVGPDPALMRAVETITASVQQALNAITFTPETFLNATTVAIRAGVINGVTAAACDLYPAAQPPALAAIVAQACAELERITGQGGSAIRAIVERVAEAAQGVRS